MPFNASNAEILNTVRQYAPNDYQTRVPAVTQASVQMAFDALNSYLPDWNVFWDILLNRVGRTIIRNKSFNNPLKPFKQATMRFGTQVQEISTNLIKAKGYDKYAVDVWTMSEPELWTFYHKMNVKHRYDITVPMEDVLRGAFNEGSDLAALLNAVLAKPMDSMENDEFLMMVDVLREHDLHGGLDGDSGFYNIQMPDFSTLANHADLEDAARQLVREVRRLNTNLRYYSADYSPVGRAQGFMTKTDNSILLIDSTVDAVLTVDMRAYMFNEQAGDLLADRIVVLPKLPVEGTSAMLVDEDFFMCFDNLSPVMLDMPLNAKNMTKNYFLHVWQTMSSSKLANAIKFSKEPTTDLSTAKPTYTAVTLTDDTGAKTSTTFTHGDTIALTATVTGTGAFNPAVAFKVETFNGSGKAYTLPADVFVDSRGNLHTGSASAKDVIKVTATSIGDNTKSASYTATLK